MYAYEGLGSIYWHMVSKLLLSVQECYLRAVELDEPTDDANALARGYDQIRAGLGFNKSSREYGAFPADPYSHTPMHAGAQQPGMTGQVKEEILSRWGTLGVRVEDGCLRFAPTLLRRSEFQGAAQQWSYYDIWGRPQRITVPSNSLAFTFCQVPVIYTLTPGEAQIRVIGAEQTITSAPGDHLAREISASLFQRTGEVARLEVLVPQNLLR
jgi:hypothetical protein